MKKLLLLNVLFGLVLLSALAAPVSHAQTIDAAEMIFFACDGVEIGTRSDLGTVDITFELQRTNPAGPVEVAIASFQQTAPQQATFIPWGNFSGVSYVLSNGMLADGDYVIVNSPQDDPVGRTATLSGFNTIPLHYSQGPLTCVAEPFCGDGILDPGEECDDGNNLDGDGCSADCTIERGDEGCTPGYWKNHLDKWVLDPSADFDTTFGVDFFDPDITLEDAVNRGGGGIKKVARHGTAGLLNAMNPDVNYPLTGPEVKAAVQAQDVSGISTYNELSDTCPAEFD